MCALSGGSFTGEEFSERCGESKAIKYETIRMESSFSLGGTVSGNSDGNLILVDHANAETVEITGNGVFSFQQQVECGHYYDVRVSSQSSNRECSVQRGSGFVTDENVQDIRIECVTLVTGLPTPQPTLSPTQGIYDLTERRALEAWGVPGDFEWNSCYRSNLHGWSLSTARSRCSGSRAVVFAVLDNGKRIGGYSQIGIPSSGGWYNGYDNFLFSLTNMHKHQLLSGRNGNSYLRSSSYLQWGSGSDIRLYLDSSNLRSGSCNLGATYACRVGSYGSTTCRNDFCGSYNNWIPVYVEIFN